MKHAQMREVSVNGDGTVVWGLSNERVQGGYKIYYIDAVQGRFWIPVGGFNRAVRGAVSISAF